MKRTDAAASQKPSLRGRFLRWKQSMGVRSRIFVYFLLFTAVLLALLWLFQIVWLDDFYRYQKKDLLRTSSESLVRNINNADLQELAVRIAEQNNVCVLITTADLREVVSAEASPGCIIHHMSREDMKRFADSAEAEDGGLYTVAFPMLGFKNYRYDAGKFEGRVPPSDDGHASSMVTVQRAYTAQGDAAYVFLNALITPVIGTVQTIRNELYFISAVLVLMSFVMSLVLSRRITRPLVDITSAARGLSRGEYQPVEHVDYREIAQLNAQLTQAAQDLRRVEQMQRELIANISHDLRTPLTLIEGYAEVMRDLPGENTPENMQVIIDETRRLSTLVNAVLELNQTRNANDELKRERFCLTQSIRAIMTRYAKLTEQRGYHVVFEPTEDVWVMADELKVEQVLYNLINNALTYTGEDHTVTVSQRRVEDGRVRIVVTDSGEGIDPADLPHIWDRYYRGSKPHKRAAIGSGLGLSIVKGIMEKHGLPYGAESEQGKGSSFWFEMNLA